MRSLYDLEMNRKKEQENGMEYIPWCEGKEREDGYRFVSDPYQYDMNGVIINEWMNAEEHTDSAMDI